MRRRSVCSCGSRSGSACATTAHFLLAAQIRPSRARPLPVASRPTGGPRVRPRAGRGRAAESVRAGHAPGVRVGARHLRHDSGWAAAQPAIAPVTAPPTAPVAHSHRHRHHRHHQRRLRAQRRRLRRGRTARSGPSQPVPEGAAVRVVRKGRYRSTANTSGLSEVFNPDVAVIGNFTGAAGKNDIDTRARLEMGESEASFQAIVGPYARGISSSRSRRKGSRWKRGS